MVLAKHIKSINDELIDIAKKMVAEHYYIWGI